ncbi:MAG TPA: CBS domain-containing protein [Gemmatimonadaceae bacterium]|jgi:CBS domain-containing protein|nr:CBS domain-containing protein [Gemmatimonadaceae bacterium]
MKAQDIMSRNPTCVTPETPLSEAARLMKQEDIGVVPVVESENSKRLVGLITDRDIAIRAVAEGRDGKTTSVGHVMTSEVRSASPDDSVDDVMTLMGREQVRRVPIVDERGALVGIVAQADIVLEAKDDKQAEKTVERISEPGGRHSR